MCYTAREWAHAPGSPTLGRLHRPPAPALRATIEIPQDLWAAEPASTAERWSNGRWLPVAHLTALSRKLSGMWEKPIRLIVSLPPRHGKSELCSHWLPVWFLTVWPAKHVILTSYEADFAANWGRRVRNTLQETGLAEISGDSQAADHWETKQGGGMVTAGTGGPITGRGADLLVVDDPVKNAEEASSPTYRDRTWEWWQTTARSRLEPKGSIVIIMTRWHVDDLVGRLLADATDNWDYVRIPAIDEKGRALWPARYDEQALKETRQSVGELAWQSMYMQQPSSVGGRYFFDLEALRDREGDVEEPRSVTRNLVRVWRTPVVGARYVAGGDVAWGETGAYSCLSILDWRTGAQVAEIYGRPSLEEMADETVKLCRAYNNAYVGIERNGEGAVVVERMKELGYTSQMYFSDNEIEKPKVPGWLTTSKTRPVMLAELDEAIRTSSLIVRCPDAIKEMRSFVRDDRGHPRGAEGHYDDHVMSLAIAWQMRKRARLGSSKPIVKLEYEATV